MISIKLMGTYQHTCHAHIHNGVEQQAAAVLCWRAPTDQQAVSKARHHPHGQCQYTEICVLHVDRGKQWAIGIFSTQRHSGG